MKLSRLTVNTAYGTMFHKNAVFTKTEYLQETGRTRNNYSVLDYSMCCKCNDLKSL